MVLRRSAAAVHVITTGDGIPVEFIVTAGVVHDNTTFQGMDVNLPQNSHLYRDIVYINKVYKDFYEKFNRIWLKAAIKKLIREKYLGRRTRK